MKIWRFLGIQPSYGARTPAHQLIIFMKISIYQHFWVKMYFWWTMDKGVSGKKTTNCKFRWFLFPLWFLASVNAFLCIWKYKCAFPVEMLSSDSFVLFFRFSKVRKINFYKPFGGRCVVRKLSWKDRGNRKYSWTDQEGNFPTSEKLFNYTQVFPT